MYEIYYEADLQSGKEYLSTVRCGIADRDEEVLHTADNEDAISANLKGSHDNPSQENSRNESKRTTSEDEWVEVKVPDPLITQDYYEATAQISDAHPCTSLTIRLLSVQSKDSVYVDAVYVFADPVDSTDGENQAGQADNSSGNSLMAMLLPTLLQMSKTKGASAIRTQDNHTCEASRKQNLQESVLEATSSTNGATKSRQDGNSAIAHEEKIELQDVNTTGVNAAQLQCPPQVSLGESKTNNLPPNDRIKRAVDQIFSRMGRLEDLFLRFEDNLLKPINSIEARLHRVEQQLEVLTNKQKNFEPPPYSRFCAPNFSSVVSGSNSFYQSESDYPCCEEFASNIKSSHSDVHANQADDVSDSVKATHLLPSLVVTAPEFSNCDDEEENQDADRFTESSGDKPRNALTVDDALASALAGFVSSISSRPQNHIPSLSVKAPEFSNEEDTEVDKEASPRGKHETGTDGTKNINGSLSNEFCTSLDGENNVERSLNDNRLEETAKEVGYRHFEGGAEDEPSGRPINKTYEQADDEKAGTQNFERSEVIENGEVNTEANSGLVHDKTDVQSQFFLNGTNAFGSDLTPEDATSGSDNKDRDILRDILEFSHVAAASMVDFESPVLDVQFISQNSHDRNFTLEALFSNSPEFKSELATCLEESHGTIPSEEHCNLISVDDGEEPLGLVTNSQIYVDFDYCSLPQESLSSESETPMASTSMPSCSHETFPTSLI